MSSHQHSPGRPGNIGKKTHRWAFHDGRHPTTETKCLAGENKKKLALLKEKNFIEKDIILGIRPEAVFDSEEDMEKYPQWVVERKVDVSELLGAESQITVKLPGTDRAGQSLTAKVPARVDVHMGDTIRLALNMNKCHFFDPETQVRIKRD